MEILEKLYSYVKFQKLFPNDVDKIFEVVMSIKYKHKNLKVSFIKIV